MSTKANSETLSSEIRRNELEIAKLQRKNEKLKRDYILQRFQVGQRCRVTLEFDDGHNGARRTHRLLARVSQTDGRWIRIQFDQPYRFVSDISLPCEKLFSKYLDYSFFTQQGFAHVVRIARVVRKVE